MKTVIKEGTQITTECYLLFKNFVHLYHYGIKTTQERKGHFTFLNHFLKEAYPRKFIPSTI